MVKGDENEEPEEESVPITVPVLPLLILCFGDDAGIVGRLLILGFILKQKLLVDILYMWTRPLF
jgi:hypothetical protein